MGYHAITTKKRRKLFDNIRKMCIEFRLPPKIRLFCHSLIVSMKKVRKLEALTVEQLDTLRILAQMRVDSILMEAEDCEGAERARLMLEASSWMNHMKSVESVLNEKA